MISEAPVIFKSACPRVIRRRDTSLTDTLVVIIARLSWGQLMNIGLSLLSNVAKNNLKLSRATFPF